jgi:hypothetical protein
VGKALELAAKGGCPARLAAGGEGVPEAFLIDRAGLPPIEKAASTGGLFFPLPVSRVIRSFKYWFPGFVLGHDLQSCRKDRQQMGFSP